MTTAELFLFLVNACMKNGWSQQEACYLLAPIRDEVVKAEALALARIDIGRNQESACYWKREAITRVALAGAKNPQDQPALVLIAV